MHSITTADQSTMLLAAWCSVSLFCLVTRSTASSSGRCYWTIRGAIIFQL